MLPIAPDFFRCFARMIEPEQVQGYTCKKCNNIVVSDKFVAPQSIPDIATMTL